MLRSMYSGISGLKNFQTKLDVIGNNIANVNTFGYKKSRVVFKDLISQTAQGGTASNETTRGGTNPMQIGLGAQLGAIDTIHTEGNSQFTGRPLDFKIAGDGYFIVGADGDTNPSYTRAGNFYIDDKGALVNGDGLYVLQDDFTKITIPEGATSMSVGKDGVVTVIDANGTEPVPIGRIGLAKFNNTGGLLKTGSNLFKPSPSSGPAIIDETVRATLGTIESSMLEMSNVDLSEEFTEMIVAQRGFQANTRIITTSDEILQELVNLKR
ncbi:flagellar basal body rod protein FlgG [Bacillus sp. JJ722]|uniref:flagellar basal body rod protein FlgG n=1 Tax=Bacillus sp. JJ722 TaxID=3122973 RepID=UPI002FFF2230